MPPCIHRMTNSLPIPQSYLQKICHMLGYPQVATPLALLFFSPFFHILSSVTLSLSHLFSFTHIAIILFFLLVIIDIIYRLDSHFFFLLFFYLQKTIYNSCCYFFFWYIGVWGFSHSQPSIYTGSKITSLCPSLASEHIFCCFWMF